MLFVILKNGEDFGEDAMSLQLSLHLLVLLVLFFIPIAYKIRNECSKLKICFFEECECTSDKQ